jgi:hypothetical protein
LVGVFNADNKLSAVFFGKRIIEKSNIGGADVWVARWARRNSNPDRAGWGLNHDFLVDLS